MKRLMLLTALFLTLISHAQCWQMLSGGGYHVAGIRPDGTLWTWGYNDKGQLGDGTNTNKNVPQQVGTDTDWIFVSAGNMFTAAIKSNGTLWTWGLNADGQLGIGSTVNKNIPTQVGSGTNWVAVAAGYAHTLAKTTDGKLWAWGYNSFGQLGLGNYTNKTTPTAVGAATDWATFSVGIGHSAALKNDGSLWTWGWNHKGQLGDGTQTTRNSPTHIGSGTWQKITTYNVHTFGIKTDGTLWGCGDNFNGEVGTGSAGGFVLNLTQVGTENTWQTVTVGEAHTKAIKQDGTLWAWGNNASRAFGDTTIIGSNLPVQIGSATWSFVESGGNFSLNIKPDGSLWTCGQNSLGQLGDGTYNDRYMLTEISCPGALGMPETGLGKKAALVPNPANFSFTIAYDEGLPIRHVNIFDYSGKKVFSSKFDASPIDIQRLEAGVYNVQIITDNDSYYLKLLKT